MIAESREPLLGRFRPDTLAEKARHDKAVRTIPGKTQGE
jgi:hypothetical protein